MQIQVNTDRNIDGHESLAAHARSVVENALDHLSHQITRVELHLSDENGATKALKHGQDDKRCVMEARLQGQPPLAVTAHAPTIHQALDSAAEKLTRALESTLGRLHDHKRRTPQVEMQAADVGVSEADQE